MNSRRRGFTLIELLAVIVILAIIALIAVPVVSNLIMDFKKKSFESSAEGLVESAKVYYSSKTDDVDFEGKTFKFGKNENITELNIKGKKPISGEVIVNVDGEIKMNVTNGEFCAFKDYSSNVITITEGTDCVKASEFPIIQVASNKTTTNTISLVANCSYESGKEIKISKYEFSKDGGKTWNSKILKDKYLNYYTYSGLKKDNKYNFVVRCVTTSGLSAEKEINIKLLDIDKTIITVPTGWAREKEVTISYPKGRYKYQYQGLNNSNDTISDDKWITVEDTENGSTHNIFKKTYTENKYIITRVLDSAGNYVDSASIAIQKIDRTPPTTPIVTYNSGSNTHTWKNNYNMSLSSKDNESGIDYYEIDWDNDGIANTTTGSNFIPWNNYNSCSTRFRAVDKVGNRSEWTNYHDIHMDTEVPGKTIVNLNGYTSGTWTSGNVTQTASATDNVGISYYQYSHDGINVATTFPNPWTINWNGQWNFYVRAIDYAGNVGEWSNVYTIRRGVYSASSVCGIASYNTCQNSACGVNLYNRCASAGVESYKSCATSGCGVASYNTCQSSACGTETYTYDCTGTCYKYSGGGSTCSGTMVNPSYCGGSGYSTCCRTSYSCTKTCTGTRNKTCATSACGVASYNTCQNSACGVNLYNRGAVCGVESYKSCATSACGVASYNTCWHT